MRVVREIPHPQVKITLFHWNNRYLIKLEAGTYEQTYKISEFDVTSEDEVITLLDEQFISQALTHFNAMAKSFQEAIHRGQ